MIYIIGALIVGYIVFVILGRRAGYPLGKVLRMSLNGAREATSLCLILIVIGIITGVWRMSGTIVTLVYYSTKVITPPLFLIIAFLITCLLSYALGTSFGVAGTVGVIFMTLARSGGVDPVITGGVILSGIFFGDRSSPISGTANMVSQLTGTDLMGNVKGMMKTGAVPFIICMVVYSILSVQNPISQVDPSVIEAFRTDFELSAWTVIPAVLMLLLPLVKVPILISMGASIVSGILISGLLQNQTIIEMIKVCILGYTTNTPGLGVILNGGGMISMASTVIIVMITCSYTGIFNGTGILNKLHQKVEVLVVHLGLFPTMIITSLISSSIFCNQVVGIVMSNDFLGKAYVDRGKTSFDIAMDIENSTITLPALIPWCILCTVPCGLIGVGYSSVLCAVYVYAIPLWTLLMKLFKNKFQKNVLALTE